MTLEIINLAMDSRTTHDTKSLIALGANPDPINPTLSLTIRPGGDVVVLPEVMQRRDALVEEAAAFTSIGDDFSLGAAADLLRDLQTMEREIESARKTLKEPYLQTGKKIDELAKSITSTLTAEVARIKGLVGVFQLARQRAVAAEQARQVAAHEARVRAEREAMDRAEAARLAAIEAGKPAPPPVRPVEMFTPAPVVAPAPTLAGVSVREIWDYEVVDVRRLFVYNPELVVLSPDNRAINALIAAGMRQVPGLKIFSTAQVSGRGKFTPCTARERSRPGP